LIPSGPLKYRAAKVKVQVLGAAGARRKKKLVVLYTYLKDGADMS
jgi:hypothetical protein